MHDVAPRQRLPNGLTARQAAFYDYHVRFLLERQRLPTLQEACADLGLRSKNGALQHRRALASKGLMERDGVHWRLPRVRLEAQPSHVGRIDG